MFKDTWDRLVLYLPLITMAGLALATYWIVHSTPVVAEPVAKQSLLHEPDYFMHGFSLRTFDANGRERTEVLGRRARHYPDTQWMEIEEVRIKSRDEMGRLTVAKAALGLTNEDSSEVQLIGLASVVRESSMLDRNQMTPRLEYRGEFLHAFMTTERVVSNKPVVLTRGADWFSADALEYDNVDQVIHMRGRVRGTLETTAR
jgi:lipopolysaccharide export system protein LptC